MTRARLSYSLLLVVAASLLLLEGCGHKRPPASATGPGSYPRAGSTGSGEPVDAGPDVRSIDNDLTSGEDFTFSDASGEGGPLADVYFEYDQSSLTDAARGTLAQHATWIKGHGGAKITVEGHCDERGTVEYNLALGDQRAQAARDYLVSLGVPRERLNAISLGKERPVDPGHTESAWAKNRRAHFRVSR